MSVTIYHNPRCSKSRQTLALLKDRDETVDVIPYLESPPDASTLSEILSGLDLEPRDLMRRKEVPYGELGLNDPSLSRDELIQAMIDNPILIERPIVRANGKIRIGRPPESVLEIL